MRAQWTASPPDCLIMKAAAAHTADNAHTTTRVSPGPTCFCVKGRAPRAMADETLAASRRYEYWLSLHP
eukprot:CAMPEP_0113723838 /NCGR_PEP_ID=MMETSP0038_2-20120614/38693_1 /TAXON_ID=2898 /ORGANISM="Cryptomonas paramecium" /LENGTH=68 /DNA_ID=CAMNT_0000653567 /DNA_START=60 /DNA_END=266 /DNA_ORIENTATION=+ /assembly_acc=CAM_ASM_000170